MRRWLKSLSRLSTLSITSAFTAVVAALLGGGMPARSASTPPPEGLDQLYGLRLDVPLEGQFMPCTRYADGADAQVPRQPCWDAPQPVRDGLVWQGVRLSPAVHAEVGLLQVRGIRVAAGRVVEVELEGMPADLGRLMRSLRQRKGAPTETERYERHGRAGGVASVRFHTWRDDRFTLYVDEQSTSDKPRLRAFVNAWADAAKTGG
jgi:hypothetical protein